MNRSPLTVPVTAPPPTTAAPAAAAVPSYALLSAIGAAIVSAFAVIRYAAPAATSKSYFASIPAAYAGIAASANA